jgi:hypothetical protein
MAVQVFRIWPENISALWSQLEPLLERAVATSSTHKIEDVRRSVMSGQAQLWCQIDGDEVQAAITTEFINYPVGLFLRVWLAGARRDRKLAVEPFEKLAVDWAQQHGCVGIEAVGRTGWLKKLPYARVEGLVMRAMLPNQ